MSQWYFSVNGKAEGPVSDEYVVSGLRAGKFTLVDLIFREGDQNWCTIGEIEKFREVYNAVRMMAPQPEIPRPQNRPQSNGAESSAKSHWSTDPYWVILKPKTSGGFEQTGPFSVVQILDMIATGEAKYSHYSWRPGYRRWVRLGNLPEFDRRKKDRDDDPVNQIIPLPDDSAIRNDSQTAIPKLSKDDLMGQIDRLRRPFNKTVEIPRPTEAFGEDLAKLPYEIPEAVALRPEPKRPEPVVESIVEIDTKPGIVIPNFDDLPLAGPKEPKTLDQAHAEVTAVRANETMEVSQPSISKTTIMSPTPAPMPPSEMRQEASPAEVSNEVSITENELVASAVPRKKKFARLAFAGVVAFVAVIAFFEVQERQADERKPVEPVAVAPKKREQASVPKQKDRLAPPPLPTQAPQTKPESVAQTPPDLAPSPGENPQIAAASATPDSGIPQIEPLSPSETPKTLEIIPLKMATKDAKLVFQTDAKITDAIDVRISAKTGDILEYPAYSHYVTVKREAGEIATLDLGAMRLPKGKYRITAAVGALTSNSTVFVGADDNEFATQLKFHSKQISSQQVIERRALFYGAVEMEKMAAELVKGFQKHRQKPKAWAQFYGAWRNKARTIVSPILALKPKSSPVTTLAFPEYVVAFQAATQRLGNQARGLDQAVNQKRQVAAAPSSLAREFKSIREDLAAHTSESR